MSACTATGKRVQILLSTYNGERFLEKQLDSILALEDFDECRVLVRDDGSSDGTREILRRYEANERIDVVYGENVGITDSYLWLLQNADPESDFYAFSDQDDIWLPQKLVHSKQALARHPGDQPLMCASLSRVIDENDEKLYDLPVPKRGVSFYNAMVQNVLPGHTQVINRRMREIILSRGMDNVHVIDWWDYLVAACVGTVEFLPEYTVLHRQHGGNAVGMTETRLQNLRRRLSYIRQGRGNAFSRQLNAFYHRYRDLMPEEYRLETERFLNSLPRFGSRLRYVLSCRAYRQSRKEDLAFRVLYLLGKYKL